MKVRSKNLTLDLDEERVIEVDSNFLKIIYFDESFATDYMQILVGGELKKTTEFITEINSGINGEAGAEVRADSESGVFSKVFSFLSGASFIGEANIHGGVSRKNDKIAKNIIENTLLADFVALLDADKRGKKSKRCVGIDIFPRVRVRPEVNSFSYIMLIAPYLSMINGELPLKANDGCGIKIDITKVGEAISKGRGYYEFMATVDDREIVLRFNLHAFRNNYTMSDLPKMELTYYAVRVGQIERTDLQVQKEFEFGTAEASKRLDYAEISSGNSSNEKIQVYDVVLAGVLEN